MAGMSEHTPEARPDLTVVIPAYNEEQRLLPTLKIVTTYLLSRPGTWEVLVVDDGSRDRTREVAEAMSREEPRVRLLALPKNRGKGIAVRTGFVAARGERVLFADADNSTPIEELDKLAGAMDLAGASIAIGSRALAESDVRIKQNPLRQAMGQGFNLVVRTITGLPISDTQCGFKLFRRDACLETFLLQRLGGFAFDAEILFIARRKGLGIVEVPVIWINSPDSRVRIWRDPALMLRDLVRIRWNALRGRYDEPVA